MAATGTRTASAMFIRVEVDEPVASDASAAKQLAGICPVDIFAAGPDEGVTIVEKNLDECILCGLCLAVGPKGAVRVVKLYDNGAVLGA
ncbi:MAG TPA: ferredoxin family protein [Dehalococcoidia bacterium]|jgi:NAD-dependent dihydropyrimidine dehydrogenase PreA subunit